MKLKKLSNYDFEDILDMSGPPDDYYEDEDNIYDNSDSFESEIDSAFDGNPEAYWNID